MSQCSVDFFDTKLNFIYHDDIDTPGIDLDYLTPESSRIEVSQTNDIPVRSLVRIEGHDNFVGVVDDVNRGEGKTTILVKPFSMIFDQPVLFDCNWQYGASSPKPLEQTIADLIKTYWLNSSDSLQNMPLDIYTTSSTTNWTFGLVGDKSDDDKATSANNHQCIVEFYDTILQNALTRYRVAIESEFDFVQMKIKVTIGVPSRTQIIEADMDDVEVVEFTIGKLQSDLNKLEIWNEDNYTEKKYYYLHTDGTYDTNGTINRITPVKANVIAVQPERDSNNTITKSFLTVAKEQADQTFGDIQWRNYIELNVGNDNSFDALNMRVGQLVQIIHLNKTYETILTGKKLGDLITLVFGTIRIDLTKKNQLEASTQYTSAKSVTKNSSTSSQ